MRPQFPDWIRRKWASGQDFVFTKDLIDDLGLHTVCQSAQCPNRGECWKNRTATFMILGDRCTRNCRFCSVDHGQPDAPEMDEPARVAEAVRRMQLRHAVITSVTRDDLPDGGAAQFAATVRAIRDVNADTTVELLTPDFDARRDDIETVIAAEPNVFGHNIETVRRLYPELRACRATYGTALDVLRIAAEHAPPVVVKSALMVGHGETEDEVVQTLRDLLDAGCEVVSIGQYLRPTKDQREVREFVHPDQFKAYEETAYALGFAFVVAGPFVRSSYRSEELMRQPFVRGRGETAQASGE
ncbi:MAG: lipoyl synthase [bacterium]|nr:lipoyl synthase [bacterium]